MNHTGNFKVIKENDSKFNTDKNFYPKVNGNSIIYSNSSNHKNKIDLINKIIKVNPYKFTNLNDPYITNDENNLNIYSHLDKENSHDSEEYLSHENNTKKFSKELRDSFINIQSKNSGNIINNNFFHKKETFEINSSSADRLKKTYFNKLTSKNITKSTDESYIDHDFIKIDYNKPRKSANDVLTFILKSNKIREKAIDPILNYNKNFLINTQKNFKNLNNRYFQENKNILKVNDNNKKSNENLDMRNNNIDDGNKLQNNQNLNVLYNDSKVSMLLNNQKINNGSHFQFSQKK